MQDIFGSVRRSLVFRSTTADDGCDEGAATSSAAAAGSIVEKINSCIRKSRVFSSKPSPPRLPAAKDNVSSPLPLSPVPAPSQTIRWRKGELIGCGAFGQVYMGMDLNSGELLAVKQVLIPANHASKEKAQIHLKEIEEEVKLLRNLKHTNIVRYLGADREGESLNILLEFVPGGSISSLLGKFGSFPESVIRMYTKQLLLGLDYLHKNGIMHRDIKGANILVDNKGCIKLADFGASKQVVELATVSGAKSMKGTPYWMAPEVIRQTGHSFSADIWSVGCTVIEMATGKPPWSQQYQEVAALFYIGTTKAHPPIPEHLSAEAKDFLLKCLQKEPELRATAEELLQHPFVTGELLQSPPVVHREDMDVQAPSSLYGDNLKNDENSMDMCNLGTLDFSTMNAQTLQESINIWKASNVDDDVCQIDDKGDFVVDGDPNVRLSLIQDDVCKSLNPISEPSYDWRCQNDKSPVLAQQKMNLDNGQEGERLVGSSASLDNHESDFSCSCGPSVSEDDDEVIDSKIRAFLDEKALVLKKLQTPLYEEYLNSLNPSCSLSNAVDEDAAKYLRLPPKSRSPSQGPAATPSTSDAVSNGSPGSGGKCISSAGTGSNQDYVENLSPQHNDWKGLHADTQQEPSSPSFSEIQRKWKEELDQELERKREMMRQATGGKTLSPKDRTFSRSRSWFASPGK